MNTIKNLIRTGLMMSWFISLFACQKLIDIPTNPSNQIPEDEVFADSSNIMSVMAGVYYNFGVTSYLKIHSGVITYSTGLSSDELSTANTYSTSDLGFLNNNLTAQDGSVSAIWTAAYNSLYPINSAMKGISATTVISPALKDQLLGELEVARALYYFNLVNLFGEVPLILTQDYEETRTQGRATVEDVYGLILADLKDAVTKLTPSYPSAGRARPNLYTAYSLLAKVYLYRGMWMEAKDAADHVLSSGIYSLEQDPGMVFYEGSGEAIWQLPARNTYSQTQEALTFVPYAPNIVPNYFFTPSLESAFESGDARWQHWVGTNSVTLSGGTLSYHYPNKYKNTNTSIVPQEAYMIFRLAEVQLIRAEAAARLGGLNEGLADLNGIRSRAGLPEIQTDNADMLLDAIMRERRVELFCEWGNRWYDLKRTGTIDQVLGTLKTDWQSTDALFPIPQTEMRLNPSLTQNEGYH